MINTSSADGMQIVGGNDYQAGVCNIGPAEIRRRRRTGHVGLAAAIALLAVLVAIDAPPIARLLVILPAALSASGYLQAALKFCAGYGALGVFNFGEAGMPTSVADEAARRADRRRAFEIALSSLGIGLVVGAVAFLLPF
jgi:hypothetical protein